MPDFWVVDSAAWRKALQVHVHDGSAWRQAKEVWVHDGSAWRKVYVSFTFTADSEYVEGQGFYDPPYSNIGGSAGIRYLTDGTTLALSNLGNYAETAWGTGGDYTSKYVRVRSYTGDAPNAGDAIGSWLQLNSNHSWSIYTINGTSTKSCTLTIDFSKDGSTIDHTVTVDLVVGIT